MLTKPPDEQAPAVILVKAYDHVLWPVQKAEKFPRPFRFSMEERIVQGSLDLLMTLVDAMGRDVLARQGSPADAGESPAELVAVSLPLAKDLRLVSNDISNDAWTFLAERLGEL